MKIASGTHLIFLWCSPLNEMTILDRLMQKLHERRNNPHKNASKDAPEYQVNGPGVTSTGEADIVMESRALRTLSMKRY